MREPEDESPPMVSLERKERHNIGNDMRYAEWSIGSRPCQVLARMTSRRAMGEEPIWQTHKGAPIDGMPVSTDREMKLETLQSGGLSWLSGALHAWRARRIIPADSRIRSGIGAGSYQHPLRDHIRMSGEMVARVEA